MRREACRIGAVTGGRLFTRSRVASHFREPVER